MQDSTNLEALISKYSQRNRRFRLRVKPPRPPSDAQIYCSFCASPRVLSRELYFFCLTCEVYVCEECYCMKRHAGRSHDVYFMGVSPSGTAVEVKPSTATTTTTTTMTPNKNEKGNNAVANTPIIIATPTVDQQKRHEHFLTYNRSLRTSYPEDYNVDDSFFTLDPNCNYITCDECVNRMVAQASAKQQSPLHTRLAESSRGGFFIADYIRGPFFRCVTCAADVCEECFERGACTTHDKGEGRDQSRHHLLYMGNAPQPDEVVVNSEAELDRALEVVAASVSPTPPMRTPGPVKRGRSSASNAFPSTPRSAPRALLPPPPPPAAAAAATPTRESTQATPQKVPNGFVQLHLPPNNVSGDVIISRQELEIVHQTQHAADFSVQRVVVAPIAAAATSPVTFLIFVVTTENNTANCNNNNNNNNMNGGKDVQFSVSNPEDYIFTVGEANTLVNKSGITFAHFVHAPSRAGKDIFDLKITFLKQKPTTMTSAPSVAAGVGVSGGASGGGPVVPQVVPLALATYILNCISFECTQGTRLKEGVRSLEVRISDGTNPLEGKAKIQIDVKLPIFAVPREIELHGKPHVPLTLFPTVVIGLTDWDTVIVGYCHIEVVENYTLGDQLLVSGDQVGDVGIVRMVDGAVHVGSTLLGHVRASDRTIYVEFNSACNGRKSQFEAFFKSLQLKCMAPTGSSKSRAKRVIVRAEVESITGRYSEIGVSVIVP
eukprot:PhM_4_TR18708/c0_g1_i1/m.7873